MMKIKKIDHACFVIQVNEKRIVTDPFSVDIESAISSNNDIVNPDYVLLSHGHNDHIDGLMKIIGSNTIVISNFEICNFLSKKGIHCIDMNMGGELFLNDIKIAMVPAIHSSSIEENGNVIYAGLACGYIIKFLKNTLYFAGDTDLFYDMKLIDKLYSPNIGLIPIGGRFTMNIEKACFACNEFLNLSVVIPIHYDTFPPIAVNMDDFINGIQSTKVQVLRNGDSIEL